MASSEDFNYSREMGISHSDLFRLFPNVTPEPNYSIVGNEIRIVNQDRQLVIQFGEEKERRIASLFIPVTDMLFHFSGYTKQQSDEFMQKFDRVFHRGGG